MDLWYTENHTENVKFSIRVDKHLKSVQSEYQRIDIFESAEFGRMLTLDGYLMVTESDEYIYHEMITHVPMAVNPGVSLYYQDGLRFVRGKENVYDLIIVDSTDPFGVGEGLFTREFYGNCYMALKENGILVNQHESTFYKSYANSMKKAHSRIKSIFPVSLVYQAHIPTYPSGHWLFGFASKTFDPRKDLKSEWWNSLGIKTRYYNTILHTGCFAIPNNVRDQLRESGE